MSVLTELQFETTNLCNTACSFCPNRAMTRKRGEMDMGLFMKWVDEAAGMNLRYVYLNAHGEPLMDSRLGDRIRYARKELGGGVQICLYTNAGKPIAAHLAEALAQLSILVVSYADKVDPQMRLQNIELLKKHGVNMEMHTVPEYTEETRQVAGMAGIPFRVCGKYNWNGMIESSMPIEDGLCYRTQNSMTVLWDGRVAVCCQDMNGDVIAGDARTALLKDIWVAEKAVLHRTKPKSALSFCCNCNMQVLRVNNGGPQGQKL